MSQIARYPHAITRKSFVARFARVGLVSSGNIQFDEIGGPGKDHIQASVVKRDLRQLAAAERRVRTVVNKRLAHLDRANVRIKAPTIDELDDAVSLLHRLFAKYDRVLTGAVGNEAWPKWLMPGSKETWKTVFRYPWLPLESCETGRVVGQSISATHDSTPDHERRDHQTDEDADSNKK